MTEIGNEVMVDLNNTEVINGHLLQGNTERIKVLIPDLTEEITKVTVILLQETPPSIIHSCTCWAVSIKYKILQGSRKNITLQDTRANDMFLCDLPT